MGVVTLEGERKAALVAWVELLAARLPGDGATRSLIQLGLKLQEKSRWSKALISPVL